MDSLIKLKEYEIKYYSINDENSLIKIYELFVNKIVFEPENGAECIYIAIFYQRINKDFENAKKYYLMAVEYSSIYYIQLATFFNDIRDYENAKKYYLMTIEHEHNNGFALNSLGIYFCIKKNYKKGKKYFLLAVKHGNPIALNNLGCYYFEHKNDNKKAEMYYLNAIDHGYFEAIYNLARLYFIIKDYENAEKYYLMIIEYSNPYVMDFLNNYPDYVKNYENAEKYYSMAIKYHDYQTLAKFIIRSGNIKVVEKFKNLAMFDLSYYYQNIKKDYNYAKKYYLMTVEHGHDYNYPNSYRAFNFLVEKNYTEKGEFKLLKFYSKCPNFVHRTKFLNKLIQVWDSNLNSDQKIFLMKFLLSFELRANDDTTSSLKLFVILLQKKNNLMKLHFQFIPNSIGYHDAKQNFDDLNK